MGEELDRIGMPEKLPEDDFVHHCGMKIEKLEKGYCRIGCDIASYHLNYMEIAHGGVAFTLLDTAAGKAGLTLCAEGKTVVSLCASIHFLRPVRKGHIYADGKVVKAGKKTALVLADVMDDAGNHYAHGEVELFFVDMKKY